MKYIILIALGILGVWLGRKLAMMQFKNNKNDKNQNNFKDLDDKKD